MESYSEPSGVCTGCSAASPHGESEKCYDLPKFDTTTPHTPMEQRRDDDESERLVVGDNGSCQFVPAGQVPKEICVDGMCEVGNYQEKPCDRPNRRHYHGQFVKSTIFPMGPNVGPLKEEDPPRCGWKVEPPILANRRHFPEKWADKITYF